MKILIVKTSSLGDLIHVFPALEALRCHYPEAQIDWIVEEPFAPLLQAHPGINNVLRVDTKRWRKGKNLRTFYPFVQRLRQNIYDVLIDFQGNIKSGMITFLARAKKKIGFGRKTVPEFPNLFFTSLKIDPDQTLNIREQNLALLQPVLESVQKPICSQPMLLRISSQEQQQIAVFLNNPILASRKKILVANGSQWKNKQTPLNVLLPFLQGIAADQPCAFLFIWGSDEEKKRAEELQKAFPDNALVVERLSLPALQNLMAAMDLVIGMDSLPLHLAGTTATPLFGIFGPSSGRIYLPNGALNHFFQGPCPYAQSFVKRCPKLRTCPTGACMSQLRSSSAFKPEEQTL